MPSDCLYYPIQTGSAIWEYLGYSRDDTGDNISRKNLAFNEMCALYWAWKNMDVNYLGMVHYRRYLSDTIHNGSSVDAIMRMDTAKKILQEEGYDIVLPPKKNYYFSSLKTHYIYSKRGYEKIHARDIEVLRESIIKLHPESLEYFDDVMNSNKAHMLNICLMKKELYDSYCEFVFGIMFNVEEILSKERADQTRYLGALNEFLMDVWIRTNNLKYIEVGLVELEKQPLIKRAIAVLKRSLVKV